jgi:hypothetical protein
LINLMDDMRMGVDQQPLQLERRFLVDPQAGPVFPNPLPDPTRGFAASNDPAASSAIDLTIPGKDYRNPYTHQADVALEHAISANMNLAVSWVWSRALHLTTVRDLNVGRGDARMRLMTLRANRWANTPRPVIAWSTGSIYDGGV